MFVDKKNNLKDMFPEKNPAMPVRVEHLKLHEGYYLIIVSG